MKELMRRVIEARKRAWVVVTLFLCITCVASATDMIWVGYGNSVWDGSPDNWYNTGTGLLGPIPTASDNVPMPMPACTISATTNAVANILWIAPWAGNPGNLTMNGGTLTTANNLWVGSQDSGTFNLNAGAVTVGTQLMLGANPGTHGYMTMHGGSVGITSEGLFLGGNGVGQLDIYGGTITAPNLGFGVWGSGSGMINFHDGGTITLVGQAQNSNLLGNLEFWMGDGEINNATLAIVGNDIVLTPEPVTLALLGLGSLIALRQRRK